MKNIQIIFTNDDDTTETVEFNQHDILIIETNVVNIKEYITNILSSKKINMTTRIVIQSGRGSQYTDLATQESIIQDLIDNKSDLLKSAKQKQKEQEVDITGHNEVRN